MSQKTSTSSRLPPWIERAREYIGVTEDRSPNKHNPKILAFLKSTDLYEKHPEIPLNDETSWCAAFVAYCLKGIIPLPSNSAVIKSYENVGEKVSLNKVQPGDIIFFARIPGLVPIASHIGFVSRAPKDGDTKITVIAGNNGKNGAVEEVRTYAPQ
jgi:uncharacterized protein (TIGR02594 family)